MFDRTRARVSHDTETQGLAGPAVVAAARRLDPARHVFLLCCVLAAIVHLPAIPLRLMGWLDLLLDAPQSRHEDDPIDAESFIPIELDLDDLRPAGEPGGEPEGSAQPGGPSGGETELELGAPPTPSATAPPAVSASAPPPPPPPPPGPSAQVKDDALDAGPPDAAPPEDPYADAGPPDTADAGPEDAGPDDAGLPDAAPVAEPATSTPPPIASLDRLPDAGPPAKPLQDPDELTKVTKGLTAAPNVQVLLVGKQLRTHAVGKELGKLLSSLREWKSFFEGTGIDPVRDLEHMQITGPELRNSSQVVSILEFSSSPETIKKALDVVVQRGGGSWLEGKPFPTARARADRAPRLFVILPTRRILAVLPGKDEAKIDDLARLPAYPADLPFAIQISMVTPHRAFRTLDVIEIPDSILKMRLRAYAHGAGGGKLELQFLDASPEKATEHATKLTEQWGKVQAAAMLGLIFLDDMPFHAEGATIVGSTTFTREQLERILALADKTFAGKGAGKSRGAKGTVKIPITPRKDGKK